MNNKIIDFIVNFVGFFKAITQFIKLLLSLIYEIVRGLMHLAGAILCWVGPLAKCLRYELKNLRVESKREAENFEVELLKDLGVESKREAKNFEVEFTTKSKAGNVEQNLIEITANPVVLSFKNKGVDSLWHMTHRDNVVNIMRYGILSNTQAINSADPVDISDHGVQRRREAKDPIYGRKIHDYTPTYFNTRNPMLYVRKNIQDELCLIEISLSALSEENFLFTDGNAASTDTLFYNSLDDLVHLPWAVLNASYWNEFDDGKRKRCAEVLIYPSIEPKHIKQIHCYSDVTLQQLSHINCNISKTRELFF